MTKIDYSDSTSDVTDITYDRLGRPTSLKDAVTGSTTGSRAFTYRSTDLKFDQEIITADSGGLYSKTITRTYEDGTNGTLLGRPNGFTIGADYATTYGYDIKGRLEKIASGPGLPAGGVAYERIKNGSEAIISDAVEYIRYKTDTSTTVAQTQRKRETTRGLIDYLENKVDHSGSGLTSVSKYDYVNDTFGRRTAVETSGTAFGSTTAFNLWTYDDRGELESSKRYTGSYTPTPSSGEVTAERRTYHYDPIGNRTDSTEGTGGALYYCTETANQYTATDDNFPSCPSASETFGYDEDRNLISDGTLTYVWDGENRLKEVYPTTPDANSKKLVFTYDYASRRVRKQVFERSGGAWNSTASEDWRFVYDRWNIVLVLNGSNNIAKKYTWGLDLNGLSGRRGESGIHGAAGISGLLAVEETSTSGSPSYWFFYNGNGNVSEIVQNDTGYPTIAHYEYDPYGNTILASNAGSSSTYVNENPFRFSTRWRDSETGHYSFALRYYSPRLGRWLNRDPIGYRSGPNLLKYVRNNPISFIDPLGTEEEAEDPDVDDDDFPGSGEPCSADGFQPPDDVEDWDIRLGLPPDYPKDWPVPENWNYDDWKWEPNQTYDPNNPKNPYEDPGHLKDPEGRRWRFHPGDPNDPNPMHRHDHWDVRPPYGSQGKDRIPDLSWWEKLIHHFQFGQPSPPVVIIFDPLVPMDQPKDINDLYY